MPQQVEFEEFNHESKNISARLFENFRGRIVSGELPAGYCFPNENQLCTALGIGRSSLREAYAMLAQFGYIRRTKRGTFVNSLYEIMNAAPAYESIPGVSEQEYKDFRIMIEGETARFAARNATDAEISNLRACVEELSAESTLETLVASDMGYHLRIAEIGRNPLLCNTIVAVSGAWKTGVCSGFDNLKTNAPQMLRQIYEQHLAVYEAIVDRDEERAKKKMEEHLKAALY